MHSIQFRLNALFVVVITAVLALSGVYSHFKLRMELEQRYGDWRKGVMARLQNSVPPAMWDLSEDNTARLLDAEMASPDVLSIRVLDLSGTQFVGRMRNSAGEIVPFAASAGVAGVINDTADSELLFRGIRSGEQAKPRPVGRMIAIFSREPIEAALRGDAVRKLIEIVALDLLLVAVLAASLRLLVFAPLRQLRDGLFDLASDETTDVAELPERRRDEFGDVVRGFNRILHKLTAVIARSHEAEEEARRASAETARAYEDLRSAQESLLQAERLASLGGLVAGVAHEINTPVGITLTSASVLQDATKAIRADMEAGGIRKSQIVAYLDTAGESARLIMANAERAARLIHSFKQIAVDQTHEARRQFGLREYAEEVITSLKPRTKKTHVSFSLECPQEIRIDGYPGAFGQVLTNLIMNSLTHAFEPDDEGTIVIRAVQQGDTIELDFSDDGKGIAPSDLDRIFDPFFTTKRGQGGTGLGLNIVYNLIAKQFGGTIKVASTLGQGTCFAIRFPTVAPQQETA